MFFSVFDEESATLVGKFEGSVQTDADFERCLRAVEAADASAAAHGMPYICVFIIPSGVQRPPPIWRNRMAEANNALRATEHRHALVMSDALMRGVLTAITWLTRPRDGHQLKPFDTFAAAAAWIRSSTGRPYPDLERLHAAVDREMARHAANG